MKMARAPLTDSRKSGTRARAPAHEAQSPVYLELPFPPSVNGIWRAAKGRHYCSPRYQAWKTEAGFLARSQARTARVSGPYAVQLNFVRPDRRRRDLDNLLKSVIDLLRDLSITDDDSECQQIDAKWVGQGPALWVAVRPCRRWGEAA